MKTLFSIMLVTVLVSIVALVGVLSHREPVAPVVAKPQAPRNLSLVTNNFAVDPLVTQMAAELGIDPSVFVREVRVEVLTNVNCAAEDVTGTAVVGCYYGDIKIQAGADTPEARRVLAHEYLHYVWSNKLTAAERRHYGSLADSLPLAGRFSGYTFADHTQLQNEEWAVGGTEVADNLLPADLLAVYGRYLPNRNALPSYYR